ncbi:Vitamin K-dependent gamma-carboxylase [Seminavis robusta]|uniref:Vitamin K-dependent gamma-carboxylase n=1 Tax=Seminavis robusta TaxID=568900 RepID=A0A9N8HSL2_9STRA|nr:Vitamin K-dependent gamma-carboxylase [Seminavis robusta]|eukprot:Sro1179_g249640.1 Vitamin K-dependent gamma-carboxylase (459) ;mRNA; f:22706-24192
MDAAASSQTKNYLLKMTSRQPHKIYVGRYDGSSPSQVYLCPRRSESARERSILSPHQLQYHHQDEKKDEETVHCPEDDTTRASSHPRNKVMEDIASNPSTALYISAVAADVCDVTHKIDLQQSQLEALQQQLQAQADVVSSPWALMLYWWNMFFHARVGESSILLASCMRIAYALLVLFDKALLTLDLQEFLSPSEGYLPLEAERSMLDSRGLYTPLQLFPQTDTFLWTLHWIGVIQAVLLLLGVAPKFNAAGVLLSHVTLQHQTTIFFDGQDVMFRVWCFHLISMPIHRLTIMGWMRQQKQQSPNEQGEETYPIWPFRLFQIQICLVYLGAAGVKWLSEYWTAGTSLFFMVHNDDFYGKFFNPDILFNYMGPLKCMTWAALLIETLAPILVWPATTRKWALGSIILLHFGMEISLNMHCFEWLTILAWCSFLAEPISTKKKKHGGCTASSTSKVKQA